MNQTVYGRVEHGEPVPSWSFYTNMYYGQCCVYLWNFIWNSIFNGSMLTTIMVYLVVPCIDVFYLTIMDSLL